MINEGYDVNKANFPAEGSWNRQYTYDNIGLWQADAWKDRFSCICSLAQWIEKQNNQLIRSRAGAGTFAGRTDGVYDSKTCSVAYPDILEEWDKKGLFYKCTEMGGVCWIAMLPHAVRAGTLQDPRILVVLHDADFMDPNWAMDTLEYYRAYNELAAQAGLVVLYVVTDGPDQDNTYIGVLQELLAIFHLKEQQVFLDVSTIFLAGSRLGEIKEFTYQDGQGSILQDPDGAVEHLGSIPVLDMTGRWQNRVSMYYRIITSPRSTQHPAFNQARHIHSACGRKMTDGMLLEHTYPNASDPGLLKYWQAMGLRYESHAKNGEQWLSIAPLSASEEPEKKLPVMLILQEVSATNAFQAVNALSLYYEYCDLVAQGQLICLFFALETPEDNDLFMDILQDAAEILPIDKRRVYVTGQSHNGHFASEFMRRHPAQIAAVATLSNAHGLLAPAYSQEVLKVTDEMVDLMSTFDVPLININAICENEFVNYNVDTPGFRNAADSWQRRLKAFNCPEKTYAEIAAARTNPDLATRMVGVPNDGSEIQFKYGCECYIANIRNKAGRHHLRLVTLENLPHMNAPQMPELSWDFVKRFARDLETGQVVELA
jgi:hypothetical protein